MKKKLVLLCLLASAFVVNAQNAGSSIGMTGAYGTPVGRLTAIVMPY